MSNIFDIKRHAVYILCGDELPPKFAPHMNALLEDASVGLLVAMVEQVHESTGSDRTQLWSRMRELAGQLDCLRDLWQ